MHHVDNSPDNVIIPVHAHIRARGQFNAQAQALDMGCNMAQYGWRLKAWFKNADEARTLVLVPN